MSAPEACAGQPQILDEVSQHVALLLLTPEGFPILQERDDDAARNAGCMALWGGALEGDETVVGGGGRELFEETMLRLLTARFEHFATLRFGPSPYASQADTHVLIVRDVDPSSLQVQEGKGYHVMRSPDELTIHKFSPESLGVLQLYFMKQL